MNQSADNPSADNQSADNQSADNQSADNQSAADNKAKKSAGPRIVYCHCAFAKVVPPEVKTEVLAALTRSRRSFEAVADLCEMSARKDAALGRIALAANEGPVVIAACFPRAVRWLFHGAGTPLPEEGVSVLNMREQSAESVVSGLLNGEASA